MIDVTDAELLCEIQRRIIARENAAPTRRGKSEWRRLHRRTEALLPALEGLGIDVAPLSGSGLKPPGAA
ncbi:hypothetical protein [Sandarakinorhabdus sp.]|uniref:hypothetical protein n=1 Tax=Sandarakinorhabdus sp. TaxID=1916663 RepID=UPI00286E5DD6|nr:hypothetical protein [Sandarakinorhabdus sp.]